MRPSVTVAAALALMCATAWAQGAPNAQPQEARKCSKDRRGGSC